MKKLSAADNTGMAMYSVIGFAVLALIAPVVAQTFGGNYWVRVLDFALLYILLALGLNIVVGFAGLLDLGYIAFFAVGAYMMALLSSPHLTSQFAWLAHLFPGGIHLGFWWVLLVRRRRPVRCWARQRSSCAGTTWQSSRWGSAKSSASS